MDYVLGGVAALVSGNVTPNRPKHLKRAVTPTKHQLSPNVTPKSQCVDDRSIFLSPTMQKKKAVVKKSPKRIFQNPDLEEEEERDSNLVKSSPKTDKVKKHLKDDLDVDSTATQKVLVPMSPKLNNNTSKETKKNDNANMEVLNEILEENKILKKKKRKLYAVNIQENGAEQIVDSNEIDSMLNKKKNKKTLSRFEGIKELKPRLDSIDDKKVKQKKKKNNFEMPTNLEVNQTREKSNKKNKQKKKLNIHIKPNVVETVTDGNKENKLEEDYINPNAVTNQDTDSEHESDDDMVSENEEINKKTLETGTAESSEDEEEPAVKKTKLEKKEKETPVVSEDEVKRTLFVGNVPLSKKIKKEVKKIFNEYGVIETVRIRTVPVKDARVTPKMAVIKNELHPDRTTVNVYIKYKDPSSVDKALSANNTVLNEHHLRVSRSDNTGAAHDPKCSVFVGNIPFALEDEGLREKFQTCGEIHSVRIIRDKKTNAGKGFGYVNFASKDGVELALALAEEDLTIKNRILRVKRCTQATQKKQGSRHGNVSVNQQNNGMRNYRNQPNYGQRNDENRQNYGQRSNRYQNYGPRNNFRNQQNFEQGNHRNEVRQHFSRPGESSQKEDGAHRRIMNKRNNMDRPDGPPNKKPRNIHQPHKEKKVRKEFVGMTAEKKVKKKFNKGQKKKKAISEILTKK